MQYVAATPFLIAGGLYLGLAASKCENYFNSQNQPPIPTRVPPASVRGVLIPTPLPPTYLTPEEYEDLRVSRSGSVMEKFSREVSKVLRELDK
jgi:hypothetical protein